MITDTDTAPNNYRYNQYKERIEKLNNDHSIYLSNVYDEYWDIFCDVFIDGDLNVDVPNENHGVKLDLVGLYYFLVLKNYENAHDAWMKSIDNYGNSYAMNNMGHYHNARKDYERGTRFLLMAIDKGNVSAMYNLGHFYCVYAGQCEQAKHYLMMAIEKGDVQAMITLGNHYLYHEKNYVSAMKYFMLGWTHGDIRSLKKLVKLANSKDMLTYENLSIICRTVLTSGSNNRCISVLGNNNNMFVKWKTFVELQNEGIVLGDNVIQIMRSFETNDDIQLYKSRKFRAQKFKTIDTCLICHRENILNIDLGCGHGVCDDCYRPSMCIYKWCPCYPDK